jgi:hypothetical protein
MAYVYRHIRMDKNEPFYIGIGGDNKGKYQRANRKSYRSAHWERIINKTEYRVDILEDDLSWEEAQEKEKWWISFYGRSDTGAGTLVNHTDGGDGMLGFKTSDKTRKHLSEIRKGKCWRKPGWKMSQEHKEVIRQKMIGRSPSNKGIPLTEEQKRKISEAKKGKPSEKRKAVICLETGEIFPSIEHAERDPRFYRGGVAKVLKGHRKSLKGFTFEYYDGNAANDER